MFNRTPWLTLVCCIFLANCSSDEGTEGLQGKLDHLDQGDPFFSFLFTSEEPNGLGVSLMIHDLKVDDPCLTMAGEGQGAAGSVSFSMLRINLNHALPGTFEVIWEEPPPGLYADPNKLAKVGLVEVEDWRAISLVQASSGTLTINEIPESVPEWNEGIELKGELNVFFPVRFSRAIECMVIHGPDTWQETCTCVDENGIESQCENQTQGEDCCRMASDETIEFKASFHASGCKEFCAVAISAGPHPTGYSCQDLE